MRMRAFLELPVKGCARCGRNHRPLLFRRLARPPSDVSHWAPCPTNGHPILLSVAPMLSRKEVRAQEWLRAHLGPIERVEYAKADSVDGRPSNVWSLCVPDFVFAAVNTVCPVNLERHRVHLVSKSGASDIGYVVKVQFYPRVGV